MPRLLTASDIRRLLELLDRELAADSPRGTFDRYLDLPHLRVYVAEPHYLLAMKCAAMRLGEEFHDLEDVRYLLRYLDISTADEALAVVTRYFEEEQLAPKTRLALEELLGT